MIREAFFDISQTATLGGCTLLVVFVTSTIHHLVGKSTKWWHPKWGSFVFSIIVGAIAQLHYMDVKALIDIVVIIGNICLVYLSAIGFNTATGSEKVTFRAGDKMLASHSVKENWRSRWFS